jgi:hypothetical protein
MMKIHLSVVSSNKKTGPIPVSTSPADTCPDSCPLKDNNMCYAKLGHLAIHWNRLSKGLSKKALEWNDFLSEVRRFRKGQLWRHNQAGDLVGKDNLIDHASLKELIAANTCKLGFTYTHYPVLEENCSVPEKIQANRFSVNLANRSGFTVNLSGDNLKHADKLFALKIAPVCVNLPSSQVTNCKTPNGNRVVVCPAAVRKNVTCSTCGLCQWPDRSYIIGFPAHGVKRKALSALISS